MTARIRSMKGKRAVTDRAFYVVVLVNPKSLVCVFFFASLYKYPLALRAVGTGNQPPAYPFRRNTMSRGGRHGAEQNLSP